MELNSGRIYCVAPCVHHGIDLMGKNQMGTHPESILRVIQELGFLLQVAPGSWWLVGYKGREGSTPYCTEILGIVDGRMAGPLILIRKLWGWVSVHLEKEANVEVVKGDSSIWYPGNWVIRFARGHSRDYCQRRKNKGHVAFNSVIFSR